MKYRYVALVAAAATGASAQQQYETPPVYTPPVVSTPASSASVIPSSSASVIPSRSASVILSSSAPSSSMSSFPIVPATTAPMSYTTIVVDDCETDIETLITVTSGVTATYCPKCEYESTTAAPKPTGPAHTTVYTTVYSSLCSTGLVPVTYTVTEECAEPTPTWATGTAKDSHVPEGFTVTVKVCIAHQNQTETNTNAHHRTATSATRPRCLSPSPSHAPMAVASLLRLPLLVLPPPSPVAAHPSSRFRTAKFKHLVHLAAPDRPPPAYLATLERPHPLVVPSVLQHQVATPSALAARTALLAVTHQHRQEVTPSALVVRTALRAATSQRLELLHLMAERLPTLPLLESALVPTARRNPPATSPSQATKAPRNTPVVQTPSPLALLLRSSWPQLLPSLLSHSDWLTINTCWHSVMVWST